MHVLGRAPVGAARPTLRPCLRAQPAIARASVVAEPVSIPVKAPDGTQSSTLDLALKVANPQTARHVVHRYLVTVRNNARQGTASTKTRSEVRGGGKKPYQQKGTGRARQGSRRTPLRPGGGVVFGPKPKDWSINMNKKEKRLAMATALQSAAEDTVAVESFAPLQDKLKTKTLCDICMKVGVNVMNKHTLLVTRGVNADVNRCGRNIGKLTINPDTTINAYNILRADKIIIEKPALDLLIRRFSGDRDDAVAANKESWASEAERKKAEAEEEEKHQGKKSALKTKAKKNTLKELKPKYTKNGQRGRKGSRRLPRGAKAPAKAAASTPAAAESAAAS